MTEYKKNIKIDKKNDKHTEQKIDRDRFEGRIEYEKSRLTYISKDRFRPKNRPKKDRQTDKNIKTKKQRKQNRENNTHAGWQMMRQRDKLKHILKMIKDFN